MIKEFSGNSDADRLHCCAQIDPGASENLHEITKSARTANIRKRLFFQRETKIDNQTLAISCKQIAKEERKQTKEHNEPCRDRKWNQFQRSNRSNVELRRN